MIDHLTLCAVVNNSSVPLEPVCASLGEWWCFKKSNK